MPHMKKYRWLIVFYCLLFLYTFFLAGATVTKQITPLTTIIGIVFIVILSILIHVEHKFVKQKKLEG